MREKGSGMWLRGAGLIAGCAAAFLVWSCGGSGSSITVTFLPVDGATAQTVNVGVTATFSQDISPPAEWASHFTLTEVGTSTSLCTAVSYSDRTATCTHAYLEGDTNYAIAITDLSGVTAASALFRTGTVTTVNVTDVSKTSVATATDGEGEIAITYTFDAAPSVPPILSVESEGQTPVAGSCTADPADAKIYTCPVTALAGCTSIVDYTATLSVPEMSADHVLVFDSADDEFDNEATRTECWQLEKIQPCSASTFIIGNGILTVHMEAPEGCDHLDDIFYKANAGVTGAISLVSMVLTVGSTTGQQNLFYTAVQDNLDPNLITKAFSFASGSAEGFPTDLWGLSGVEGLNNSAASATGDLTDYATIKAPMGECIVLNAPSGGAYTTATAYPAFDDSGTMTYKTLTADNMTYFFGPPPALVPSMDISSDSLFINFTGTLKEGPAYDSTVDFIRFRRPPTGGFVGDATDCPALW